MTVTHPRLIQPEIKVRWVRGREKVDFKRPHTYLGLGQRGSGKSALMESLSTRYPKIIDLYGSRDSEGLAWCRVIPQDQILFVVGESVEISCEYDYVRASKFRLHHIESKKYRVILSAAAFYSTMDEEFDSLNKIVYDVLYTRLHWQQPWFLMVREAANFIYSRVKITKNQTIAKADFIYLLREARHMGYAVGVDTIRWTSIDKEIRDVADYLLIKRVGIQGLPRDLKFIYSYIDPFSLMNPGPSLFLLVSNRGPIAIGTFEKPWWHKEEHEDMLKMLDIQVEPGEVAPLKGERQGLSVSDFDHADIMRMYQENSMAKVSLLMKRSQGTIHSHITRHNHQVDTDGVCVKCRRVRCELSKVNVQRSVT